LQHDARCEAAIVRHVGMATRQIVAKAEHHVVSGNGAGGRLVHRVEQTVVDQIAGDRLQVRHDQAEEPVIGEDAVGLFERLPDLVKIKMFDAMGRPDGVDRAAFDRRQVGDV
jgi:hypothetical protein